MSNEEQGYHGWVNDNQALYVQEDPSDGRAKIYVQQDRSTQVLAAFVSVDAAQFFMQWIDEVLSAQAETHTELLRRLQDEQPLLFASSGAPNLVPDPEDAYDPEEE